MVDKRNIGTRRPSKKLDHKKGGSVPITKVIGNPAFRVQLPEGSQAHPTSAKKFWCIVCAASI